jgi:adenylate kinase family enzyme
MANGGIIPSDLFLGIIPPFFSHDDINDKPLLLSSVGRLMEEVPTVIKATNDSGHEIKAVIVLELTDKDVWRHYEISQNLNDRGQRADDTENALKKRLTEYNKTKPVIDYYRSMSLVLDIDDTKDTDDVTVEIIDALYSFATQS